MLFILAFVADLGELSRPLVVAGYLAAGVIGGAGPAADGIAALRRRTLDVDLLMVVAAIAAAAIGQWRDAGLLIVIFATSGALEDAATRRTEAGVRSLLELVPDEATLMPGDGSLEERTVAVADLAVGDLVLVRPGERIAVDGTVVDGASEVDESSITGEALHVARLVGDEVLAGTANGTGVLTVAVSRPAGERVIARIAELVAEAAEQVAPTQLLVARIERRWSPAVVVATLALIGVPMALGGVFRPVLERAMTFMIVASPCAVVLATMPPLLAAVAVAARRGVLVRGASVVEAMAGVDAVAFDKTGTLTEGLPLVAHVHPGPGWSAGDILALAAAAERGSEHPLGRSVVAAADARRLALAGGNRVTGFRALPGLGVTAVVDGRRVEVGDRRLLDDRPEAGDRVAPVDDGTTEAVVVVDGALAGRLEFVDRLRPTAAATVTALRAGGVAEVLVLTGDRAGAGARVGALVGVDGDYLRSGLLPADELDAVRAAQARGRRVLVVGDGVNDAPALAAADIGVAMGRRGSDLALDHADVV
ncbi:MAG: heavy metal translocating P-type ATPase, partial [Acidimicrobiales bacterium]